MKESYDRQLDVMAERYIQARQVGDFEAGAELIIKIRAEIIEPLCRRYRIDGMDHSDVVSEVIVHILARLDKWKRSDCPFRVRVIHLIHCAIHDLILKTRKQVRINHKLTDVRFLPFDEEYLSGYAEILKVDPREQILDRLTIEEITRNHFNTSRRRTIFKLYIEEGMQAKDVARYLGITVVAFNSEMQRIRSEIRRTYK